MSDIVYKLRVKIDGQPVILFENETTAGLCEDTNMMSDFPEKSIVDIEAWVDNVLVFGAETDDVKSSDNMDRLITLAELAVEKEISEP